ncbi:MAG: dihydrofolate reductase [Verrucomicrobiaceae bacterium]|nr:MAG: dihydrofolate reductase [Verrucomicrobiaceae bacterium]
MKTQYYAASSLDGFIATEDDSLQWLFALGELSDSSYPAFIAEVGALVMGSSTYEWMLRNADKMTQETGSPWPYTKPTWVFSSRELPLIEGADIRFANGDVCETHSEIKSAAGTDNIWIVGGGDLAGQYYDAGLLDELIIQIGSVTLGRGKPVFPRRVLSTHLNLISAIQIGTSMVELRYKVHRDQK